MIKKITVLQEAGMSKLSYYKTNRTFKYIASPRATVGSIAFKKHQKH